MIDLRSDTVTKPTEGMQRAMAEAAVGDDVYGEDPTVNRLQAVCAERFGMEASLFVPSGTQSNLTALLTHCARGDEFIAGLWAHTYRYEAGGAAVLGGIQPQPIPFEEDGTLDLGEVAAAIKPADHHFANTRLLCLENTQSGRAIGLPYFESARAFCDEHDLLLHLDGARIFNAAIATQSDVADFARCCESVSVCLSKGLGAPVGSVLVGSTTFIEEAHRWRKMLGGGMRQAGGLAAAGLYALDHHVDRLADDHARAERLAEGLRDLGLDAEHYTNMVFVSGLDHARMRKTMAKGGVTVSDDRWVTHLHIDDADIEQVIEAARGLVD